MKKLFSLLMTLVMLTSACAAFAEAEVVDHQAELGALLAEAGVELQPGDLSRSFQNALKNVMLLLVITHTNARLTEEQLTEWEAAMAKAHEETQALNTEDRMESISILNDAIDGMESFTPYVKSMLKRVLFSTLYQISEITQEERQAIHAIYTAVEEEIHGADAAHVEEIVAGVKAGMKELVGLHNVRDDMMFILKFLQEKGGPSFEDADDETLVYAAGEILTAAGQVMGDRIEALDAALAEIPASDEEAAENSARKREHLIDALEMLDEEELAKAATDINALANAVLQGDQAVLGEQVKHVWHDHITKELSQRNYEVLLGMDDEELRALAIELMGLAHTWQNGNLDASLVGDLQALELNWSDLSEEDIAAIKDVIAKQVEAVGVPEESRERAIEMMTNNIITFNKFSEEEKDVVDNLYYLLHKSLELKVLDAAELAELENEMEMLLYELGGDSEKYQANLEDVAAVLENVDLEQVENLGDAAKFLLTIRFMEHLEVYSMLAEEYRAKLPEIDQALFDAVKGLELHGQETTAEQLQVLEVAVVDVLTQLDIPAEVIAKEAAKTVSNCLTMSSLTEEEQAIVEGALEAVSKTLMEGNREEIRVLRNYYHQVLHHFGEQLAAPQDAQA